MSVLAKALLRKHEGFRAEPYQDTQGIWTVGYGRNLVDRGLSRSEVMYLLRLVKLPKEVAEEMLDNDIRIADVELRQHFPWFAGLDEVRQAVLVDMTVNLGASRLMGFHKFLSCMRLAQWERAAEEMLDSLWSRQVKGRAVELAKMIETGQVNGD